MIAFAIKRDRRHTTKRFVIKIGNARIDLKIVKQGLNFGRGARQDGETDIGMFFAKWRGQFMNHGKCRRDHGNLHLPGQTRAHGAHFITHGPRTANNMARPFQNTFAFGCQTLIA